jgi:hypothetical protein
MAQITQSVGEGALKAAGWRDALMSFAKNTLEQAGVMGANMAALTGVQGVGIKAAKNVSGQPFAPDNPNALTSEMAESFISGSGVGLAMGLPGLSLGLGQDAMRLRHESDMAESSRAFVQSLHSGPAPRPSWASPIRSRKPRRPAASSPSPWARSRARRWTLTARD